MGAADGAVGALMAGQVVVLPTDTVYGLTASPCSEAPVRKIFRLKQRPQSMPIALVAASVDVLLECVPELRGRDATIARALLPTWSARGRRRALTCPAAPTRARSPTCRCISAPRPVRSSTVASSPARPRR